MHWAQKQRFELITKIKNTFIEAATKGIMIDRKKFTAGICDENGVTRRKANEYIQDLLDLDFIIETEQGLSIKNKELQADINKEIESILGNNANNNPIQNTLSE
jgi:hypothetical protein